MMDLCKPVAFLLIPRCDVVESALNTIRDYYIVYLRR